MIYPSATRSGNCFDVSSPGALRHDGTSDPVGIVSMVRYVQERYRTDPARTVVTGTRPRMQIWHGTNDDTLRYPNFAEQIKQWTNVLGTGQTPVLADTPQAGWTRTRYGSSSAQAPVEAISVANTGHSLPQAAGACTLA